MFRALPAVVAIFFCQLQLAYGFQLGDHKRITYQAVDELLRCVPSAADLLSTRWILFGNLEEDLNVAKKGLVYSHYYHPHKELTMARYDSMARISALQTSLMQRAEDGSSAGIFGMMELGQTIHHLQDMAVPLHVLPVAHGMSDGFEGFSINADISSGLGCDQIGSVIVTAPEALLKETALETLAMVGTETIDIEAAKNGQLTKLKVTGRDFWQEGTGTEFGDYGKLGNVFGMTEFRVASVDFRVRHDDYVAYKQNRMKHAVRATIRALAWRLVSQLPPSQRMTRSETVPK